MLIVEIIRLRNELLVPPVPPGLVATDQQDRDSPRIERIQHPERSALHLHSKLPHVGMPRAGDGAGVGKRKMRTPVLQETDHRRKLVLFLHRQTPEPGQPLVRHFDFVRQLIIMPYMAYTRNPGSDPRTEVMQFERTISCNVSALPNPTAWRGVCFAGAVTSRGLGGGGASRPLPAKRQKIWKGRPPEGTVG